jgi:hypothetical protein
MSRLETGTPSERELTAVEVEVLRSVPVHVEQGHPVTEEGVPGDREVHVAPQVLVGFAIEVLVQRGRDAIRLGNQS